MHEPRDPSEPDLRVSITHLREIELKGFDVDVVIESDLDHRKAQMIWFIKRHRLQLKEKELKRQRSIASKIESALHEIMNAYVRAFDTVSSLLVSSKTRVYRPPGTFAGYLLRFLFSKKAFESVFGQAISDMREEHAEALADHDLWKARWIVVRDHTDLCLAVGPYLAATVGKKLVGIWKMTP